MRLQGTHGSGLRIEAVFGPNAAIPRFRQQIAIVKATRNRFEGLLFDIKQIVQANLFGF